MKIHDEMNCNTPHLHIFHEALTHFMKHASSMKHHSSNPNVFLKQHVHIIINLWKYLCFPLAFILWFSKHFLNLQVMVRKCPKSNFKKFCNCQSINTALLSLALWCHIRYPMKCSRIFSFQKKIMMDVWYAAIYDQLLNTNNRIDV